ncbi:hypothetical protein QE250_02865 [Chromatiaceae bacterium AAb-1]|nr:hypothetical protein [Chromatiaceae bacterium AAb-1]
MINNKTRNHTARWWWATLVSAVLLAVAAYLFSQSCLSFGGGGPCSSSLRIPDGLLMFAIVWVAVGPFVTVVLAIIALLKTLFKR